MISFKDFLAESPQIIHKAFIDYLSKSKDKLIEFLKESPPIMEYNGISVYEMRIPGGSRLVGILNDKIAYFVEYTNISRVPTIQTKLWRDKTVDESKGLPTKIVFDHLIKKYNYIFTDREQTNDAKEFWKRLLEIADNRGLDIGYLNVSNGEYQIKSSKENFNDWYSSHQKKIWGKDVKYQSLYAFISKRVLIK